MTSGEEYAVCRSCLGKLEGILDQRIRDFCVDCCRQSRLDPGLRKVPLQEIIKTNDPANE